MRLELVSPDVINYFIWGQPLPLNMLEAFNIWKCQRASSESQIWGFLEEISIWSEWATLEAVTAWRFLKKYVKLQWVSAQVADLSCLWDKNKPLLSPQAFDTCSTKGLFAYRPMCLWDKASVNKPSVINLLCKAHEQRLCLRYSLLNGKINFLLS